MFIFAVLLFYILTIGGIFQLRRTRPDMPRPYRAVATRSSGPVYAGGCLIEILLLMNSPPSPFEADSGIAGVPVYFLWRRPAEDPAEKKDASS